MTELTEGDLVTMDDGVAYVIRSVEEHPTLHRKVAYLHGVPGYVLPENLVRVEMMLPNGNKVTNTAQYEREVPRRLAYSDIDPFPEMLNEEERAYWVELEKQRLANDQHDPAPEAKKSLETISTLREQINELKTQLDEANWEPDDEVSYNGYTKMLDVAHGHDRYTFITGSSGGPLTVKMSGRDTFEVIQELYDYDDVEAIGKQYIRAARYMQKTEL